MKIVAIKEQDDFKARHGLVAQKAKRRKSVYVEKPAEVNSDDDADSEKNASLKQKKRKISNTSETSDDVKPTKQITIQPKSPIQSPIKSIDIDETAKKKKKKLNSLSESSELNDRDENDIAIGTSPKKKSKKEKKEKSVEPPGEKPPPNQFEYFAMHIHTGKPRKAQKAYNKLTEEEQRRLEIEYTDKVDVYVKQLKKYLASLSKEDAAAYVSSN